MIDTIFRYTTQIDRQIIHAVANVLQTNILQASKIAQGEVNHVYKMQTDKQTYIARVFRHAHWPEDGKLPWIETQLTKHTIPHAKTVYYSRENTYFPHGFMLSEYIDGISGSEAILQHHISFEEYHEKLAFLLNQIHQILVDKFGKINNSNGEYDNFIEYRLDDIPAKLDEYMDQNGYTKKIEEKILDILTPYESRLKPVLVHADPSLDNTIVTPDKKIILIDWDGALSETWIRDFSWITYWGSHLSKFGDLEEQRSKIRQIFNTTYKQTDFSQKEVQDIEKALHILQAADLLQYYYEDTKDLKSFEKTKTKLENFMN
jgi:aminoglycoside phosphotransferase (APT) family kinase protein